jgi:lipopolysaccharide heptosyltransferase I
MTSLNRILIIKLGSIGDVVHTLPALAGLKKSYPQAQVDWLVEKKSGIILQNNPLIHEVIEVDTQRWRRSLWSLDVLHEIKNSLSQIRNRHYDVAIDFQGLWKSAVLGYFSCAKQLLGFDKSALKEPGCRIFYDQKVSPDADAIHVIQIYMELVRSLGAVTNGYQFSLNVSEEDEAYVTSQLVSRHVSDFVILNPGGGWSTKNWNPINYAELHLKIRHNSDLQSILTWGPGEEKVVEEVYHGCETDPPVTFPTTIPQFISLARKAKLFVGGDTGPLHLAAACNTPVVGIYGPTSPLRNGPFHPADIVVSHVVPCGPCYKRSCEVYHQECMRLVTVNEVYQAVAQRLSLT